MENSFNIWRNPDTDNSNSENDSDIVDDSTSELNVQKEEQNNISYVVIPASDEDERRNPDTDNSNSENDSDIVDDSTSELNVQQGEQNNISDVVIPASDEDESSDAHEVISSDRDSMGSLVIPHTKRRIPRILDSEDESLSDETSEHFTGIDNNSRSSSSFKNDDVHSSTKIAEHDIIDLTCSAFPSAKISEPKSNENNFKGHNIKDSVFTKSHKPPTIDLTLMDGSNSRNDLSSRLQSLKAEETRLKMQVSEVLKDIDTAKTTLKTAVLSALPDRGVRLQMHLKGLESKLRDLRYQQSTLANEILKSQFSGSGAQQQTPKPPSAQNMFSLPTTSTDINALGKRAMETHRIQQSLTLDSLRTLHKSLENCPTEDTIVTDPKGLRVELLPHQKHGLAWLLWREKEKPSGGILADDMGLGKTLTMISLILKSNENKDKNEEKSEDSESESDDEGSAWLSKDRKNKLVEGKTLVVCPASLLGQWDGEIQSKLKRGLISVLVHHGPNREKKARRLAATDVVITTYNIISRDEGKIPQTSPLFQMRWRRIILDEAHQIRNANTQTAKAVFNLKAKSRWALTGTPIHNKQLDLQALLKFIRCKPFDDIAVWKKWVDNRNSAGLQRLNTLTKALMLRRTKEGLQQKGELKSLTNKTLDTIIVKLDEDEQEAYEKLLNFSKELFSQFLHQKAEKENALNGIAVSSKPSRYLQNAENPFEKHPELARLHKQLKEINDVKSTDILVLLLRLRQFCCHPALIKKMLAKEEVSSAGIEDEAGLDLDMMDQLTRLSLNFGENLTKETNKDPVAAIGALSSDNPLYADDRLSSKMRMVVKKLEDLLQGEDKILVVSQWVSLLNLIHGVLQAKKVKNVMLTGSVPVKERPEIVEKFNRKGHGPRVMLLSLTAGGVGLNLIGGNHLLLLDLHWNPQLENQAFDRIYRVGQEKHVHVYKFVTSETIEERILNLQQKKLEIANNVLTGAKHASKLSLDDLKMLFQIS